MNTDSMMSRLKNLFYSHYFYLALITFFAGYTAYVTAFKSGSHYCYKNFCGIYFWGVHIVDGLWHVALIEQAFQRIPFTIPILAEMPLAGYNYLLDVVLSVFYRIGISGSFLYFKVLPVLYVVLMLYAARVFVKSIKKSKTYLNCLLFFIFLSGNFYFMFALYHSKNILSTTTNGPVLNLMNMQFSFSIIGLLVLLTVLHSHRESLKKTFILAALLFVITGLKFYSGSIAFVIVAVYYGLSFLKERKNFLKYMRVGVITSAAMLAVILLMYMSPTSIGSDSEPVFTFQPLAKVHDIIEAPQKFYIRNMVLARYTLYEAGIGPRLIAIELFSLFLYVVFEFGTQMIGLLYLAVQGVRRKLSALDGAIAAGVLFGFLMSVLFIQRGQWWNIIQFLYVALFLMSIYSAAALEWLIERRNKLALSTVFVVVLLSVPFTYTTLVSFTGFRYASYIPDKEMEIIDQLRDLPDGNVLVLTHKKLPINPNIPRPLWTELPSTYVTTYSGKPSYFHSEATLLILDTDFTARKAHVEGANIDELRKDVRYIYAYGAEKNYCNATEHIRLSGTKLFGNEYASVYEL